MHFCCDDAFPVEYERYPNCKFSMWCGDLLRGEPGHPWRSPRFMPRWASRITLEVTDVRVERLQDISEDDARAEGIYWSEEFQGWTSGRGPDETCDFHGQWATHSFMKLWCSLHGDGAWLANPWVVAVSFRAIPRAEVAA
jgi:hypothetical protein